MIEQQLKEYEQELKDLPKLCLDEEPSFIEYKHRRYGIMCTSYGKLDTLINFDFIKCNTVEETTGNVDTLRGKHRSLEHIYRVYSYYFPNVSLFEVCTELYKLWKDKKIRSLLCTNIGKRTFFAYIDERAYIGNTTLTVVLEGYEKVTFKDITKYIDEQISNKDKEQASKPQHIEKQTAEATSQISSTPW